MNHGQCISRIAETLAVFDFKRKMLSKINKNDLAIDGEKMVADILSLIHGEKFENINVNASNSKAIDLKGFKSNWLVQVTSQVSIEKVKNTLEGLDKQFHSKLKFFFLTLDSSPKETKHFTEWKSQKKISWSLSPENTFSFTTLICQINILDLKINRKILSRIEEHLEKYEEVISIFTNKYSLDHEIKTTYDSKGQLEGFKTFLIEKGCVGSDGIDDLNFYEKAEYFLSFYKVLDENSKLFIREMVLHSFLIQKGRTPNVIEINSEKAKERLSTDIKTLNKSILNIDDAWKKFNNNKYDTYIFSVDPEVDLIRETGSVHDFRCRLNNNLVGNDTELMTLLEFLKKKNRLFF